MSDAADVMRDLLRKGLQVFIIIIIIIIIILGLQVKEYFFCTKGRINAHTIINHFHNLNKIKINQLLMLYSRRSSLCREQNCSSLRKKFLFPTQILLERFHDIIIATMIMFGSILSRISLTVYPFSLRCGPTSQTPFAIRLLLSITRFDILKS